MKKIRSIINWGVLQLILLLIIFSVYGAFIGAGRAQVFFNTVPLTIYWILFIVLLCLGFSFFKRLWRSPGLLFIHLGSIIVIFGAMWGSQGGHQLQKKMFGNDGLRAGYMIIYENMSEKRGLQQNVYVNFVLKDGRLEFYERDKTSLAYLKDEDERLFSLPFEIKLKDFRIEYYEQPRLLVRDLDGKQMLFEDVKVGAKYDLGNSSQLIIKEVFKNLKLQQEGDRMQAYDDVGPGSNPALKTVILYNDGTEEEQIAFANYPGHMGNSQKFSLQYLLSGMVKDYYSDVQVLEDGKVVKEKTIQVNDPLYYGGYHFYQQSYDTKGEKYTILSVSSDSGLYLVYAGYLLLMIGIIWLMWIMPLIRSRNNSEKQEGDNHGN
jgi:cytochrome c biogenesis protein ResB